MPRPIYLFKVVIVSYFVLTLVGAHWVVLQSAAWGNMVLKFSQKESLDTAVKKTLDGNNPCAMCKSIQKGKKNESNRDLVKFDKKSEFPLWASTQDLGREYIIIEFRLDDILAPLFLDQPDSPPPRV
ncbi:MAG: hypothetical protein SGI71_12115 [Verrucomicrobiota bacterium]|nr:hypothetical protein [Verrucomicrobiota bacterium]